MSETKKPKNGSARSWREFSPPPLAEAEAHRQLLERVQKMSPAEILQSSVRAGIHEQDGTLTECYRSEPPPKH